MKGSQESLTTVVVKDAANWPTPAASNNEQPDYRQHAYVDAGFKSKNEYSINLPTAVAGVLKYGQAAPANPSTDGSRQGLWPTITAHTPDMESSGPNGNSGTYLAGAVKAEENWVTPRTSGTSTRPNKTTPRQGLTLIEQAREQEKLWRTPSVAEEKNQNTSTQIYLQNQVGATPKAWATPIMGDSHLASTPEVAQKRIEEGKVTLSRQIAAQWATPNTMDCLPSRSYEAMKRQATNGQRKNRTKPGNLREQIDPLMCQAYKDAQAQANQWGTPTARDHKSGRGNEEREYKELTPMVERTQTGKLNPRWVETLMGLPVGWVMPSCKSPVTIEPTNYACSATESCLPQPSELFAF
jgi:hypothetical protein